MDFNYKIDEKTSLSIVNHITPKWHSNLFFVRNLIINAKLYAGDLFEGSVNAYSYL